MLLHDAEAALRLTAADGTCPWCAGLAGLCPQQRVAAVSSGTDRRPATSRPAGASQAGLVTASAWLHHMGAVTPSQLSPVPVQASCPATDSSRPPGRQSVRSARPEPRAVTAAPRSAPR